MVEGNVIMKNDGNPKLRIFLSAKFYFTNIINIGKRCDKNRFSKRSFVKEVNSYIGNTIPPEYVDFV